MTWTPDRVLALAPDQQTTKDGRTLAIASKWASFAGDGADAVWGECKGSGKTPYKVQIDLSEPAYNCSCPSKKFPCKHTVGLFLMFANHTSTNTVFPQTARPQWVIDWFDKRAQTAAKKAQKAQQVGVVDLKAQAKRTADRHAKVSAGIEELDLWLQDIMRSGLATLQGKDYKFWDMPAARMVDAQAPGFAGQLRGMAGITSTGSDWPERLLERLGRLYLAVEGYGHLDTLPAQTQADLQTVMGFTQKQDELLATQPAVRDRWAVLGRKIDISDDEKIRSQRTWLIGLESKQIAQVLHSAHGTDALDSSLVPGTCVDAELVFYPGSMPGRALVKARHGVSDLPAMLEGYSLTYAATRAYSEALSTNPWLERFPILMLDVLPVLRDGNWVIRDNSGEVLPISRQFSEGWTLLALSGGYPVEIFGEWNGDDFLPLGVRAEGRFVSL